MAPPKRVGRKRKLEDFVSRLDDLFADSERNSDDSEDKENSDPSVPSSSSARTKRAKSSDHDQRHVRREIFGDVDSESEFSDSDEENECDSPSNLSVLPPVENQDEVHHHPFTDDSDDENDSELDSENVLSTLVRPLLPPSIILSTVNGC